MITKWTDEEESKLIHIMNRNNFTYHTAPWAAIADKFEGRTIKSVKGKVARLLKNNPNIFENGHEWTSPEIKGALKYYLEGESFAKIHERLVNFGSSASLKDVESKLLELKAELTLQLYAYAEERGLEVKHVTLDLLKFFVQNRNTTSQLVRAGLNSRIQNG